MSECLVQVPAPLPPVQLSANGYSARQQEMAQVLGSLPLTRETWIESQAPQFCPDCCGHLGNEQVDGRSLVLFLFLFQ